MRTLGVIPARAGSKGLLGKNTYKILDKPLISYTIEAAIKSEVFDTIVVTTDSDKVIDIAKDYKVDIIKRNPVLCEDDVPMAPVVQDALSKTEMKYGQMYDVIFTLQPTSPLRTAEHIKRAYTHFNNSNADSLLSVKEELHSIWRYKGSGVEAIKRHYQSRQLIEDPLFVANGAIFISNRYVLMKGDRLGGEIALFPMDDKESIDIHTLEDAEICGLIIAGKGI